MNYPYTNGIINAIDEKILTKAKYSKLASADKADFLHTLASLGYGNGVIRNSLADTIDQELLDLKLLLENISPKRKLTDLFYLTYDAMNLKVLYKEKIFDAPHFDILSPMGTINTEVLKTFVNDDIDVDIPNYYRPWLANIAAMTKDITDPRMLSAAIDNQTFAFLFKTLKYSQGGALLAYYRSFVDFRNVITVIRSRALKWEYEAFAKMLIPGGLIPSEVFQTASVLESEAFAKSFQDYYQEDITKCLKQYLVNPNLNRLERIFEGMMLDIVKEYKNDAFNIGPIIYYFLKKVAEANNIRAIYSGSVGLDDLIGC
ncbi:MAG: V-type ATPase subunit [Candidatus Izemoplasmatales bacterium]|jgi:vacuolar-type H+-ATPase subunit C/Vma6|nr:V-type ATPase subunit [Candidatus Izemoplasmatales bacterium]MDD3865115.1 V-type ATPase subunit [Candidatus Izemoplasmatales bacterium]